VERFRALIRRQGPNPYVDVPERVSRAYSAFEQSGRIGVDGTLEGVEIRATLVPVDKGRHRLYINGGMRSAAGVEVGDTVSFALRANKPDQVRPPTDVATALRGTEGAAGALDARHHTGASCCATSTTRGLHRHGSAAFEGLSTIFWASRPAE